MSIETAEELERLRAVGRVVARAMRAMREQVRAGVTTARTGRGRGEGVPRGGGAVGAAARLRLPRRQLHQRQRRGGPRDPGQAAAARRRPGEARRDRGAGRLLRRRLRLGAGRSGAARGGAAGALGAEGAGRRDGGRAGGGAAERDRQSGRRRRSAATATRSARNCSATGSAARSTNRRTSPPSTSPGSRSR